MGEAMSGKKIIVCGGRDWRDAGAVDRALSAAHGKSGIDMIITGGCKGADGMAARWAHANCVPYLTMPANWEAHGDAAGPIRNQAMLDQVVDGVIAFPGGKGTAHMVGIAREAGVPVWEPCRG
jgi:predicted Rossmann-fold nucleotide-binding protein